MQTAMASIKIEIRRNASEAWFLHCYVGTLTLAHVEYNRRRAQGYKVRLSNSKTGFVIQEDK